MSTSRSFFDRYAIFVNILMMIIGLILSNVYIFEIGARLFGVWVVYLLIGAAVAAWAVSKLHEAVDDVQEVPLPRHEYLQIFIVVMLLWPLGLAYVMYLRHRYAKIRE